MKIRTLAAIFTVTLLLTACSKTAKNTPESIAKSVARAIINNDSKAFAQHVISRATAIDMFQSLLDSAQNNEQHKARIPKLTRELTSLKSNTNKTLLRVRTKVQHSFSQLIDVATKNGVDLAKAKFVKVLNVRSYNYLKRIKYDIYFTLAFKNTEYIVKLDDVVSISGQLYLLDSIRWKGKRPATLAAAKKN